MKSTTQQKYSHKHPTVKTLVAELLVNGHSTSTDMISIKLVL